MDCDRYYPENAPDPGMYGSDRELFKSVWRRVMPEKRPDCPIELKEEDSKDYIGLHNAPNPPGYISGSEKGLSLAVRQENVSQILPAGKYGKDSPADNPVACLGAASAAHSGQLQDFITDELADWKTYLALARCAGQSAFRALSGMAADEYRHAKRLSTAYFLISGVRFWPAQVQGCPVRSLPGALRQRFIEEQQAEAAYVAAAGKTFDPCLRELYLDLAADEARHAKLVRRILEQI